MRQPVTLQITVSPTDLAHAREILPHQLRQFGDQVEEIVLAVDLNPPRLTAQQAWCDAELGLRDLLACCAEGYPHLRVVDVDYSPAVSYKVADEFFGGLPIPDRDWRGRPIYSCFYGLWASRHAYVLHLDSDMLFGGGSRVWVTEALELLRSRPEVLVCSPVAGPPSADIVRSQALAHERHETLSARPADSLSTSVFLIDLTRFRARIGTLEVVRAPRPQALIARADGRAPVAGAELMVSAAMRRCAMEWVDFLGSDAGVWSLQAPPRSELFCDRVPAQIAQLEAGGAPQTERGERDAHDSLTASASARQPRWRRLARRGELVARNLAGVDKP